MLIYPSPAQFDLHLVPLFYRLFLNLIKDENFCISVSLFYFLFLTRFKIAVLLLKLKELRSYPVS